MAYGTLKFDTLTTSDSVNTSTDKSVNTSYIFNGVLKVWSVLDGRSTPSFYDSFNSSSITDSGTGDYRLVFTNGFSTKNYCIINGHEHTVSDVGCNAPASQSDNTHTTAQARLLCVENSANRDPIFYDTMISGDLA